VSRREGGVCVYDKRGTGGHAERHDQIGEAREERAVEQERVVELGAWQESMGCVSILALHKGKGSSAPTHAIGCRKQKIELATDARRLVRRETPSLKSLTEQAEDLSDALRVRAEKGTGFGAGGD
jgi:hypothetical protein